MAARGGPRIAGCCIAIAGPVTADTARLTNRDWVFDRVALARQLGCDDIRLINDLAALGHSLRMLGDDGLLTVRPGASGRRMNGQAIVVGVGTGFNICLTLRSGARSVAVLEAEAGHSSLPISIAEPLAAALGPAAADFRTLEDCFSGRGLSRLHGARTGNAALPAPRIIAAAASDEAAQGTVDLAADLLGRCVGELIHLYLPFEGVCLAGGVARAMFTTGARHRFLSALQSSRALSAAFDRIPISVIADDAAALLGCAARLVADTR
jgi:glucokinase